MMELGPSTSICVVEHVGLKDYIAALFDDPVDRDALKPYVKPTAENEATYGF